MPDHKPFAKEIFWTALELAVPVEREAYLERACQADVELRARVNRLLAAQSKSDSFLGSPVIATLDFDPPTNLVGSRIGPYKLREQIGGYWYSTGW